MKVASYGRGQVSSHENRSENISFRQKSTQATGNEYLFKYFGLGKIMLVNN